MGLIIVVTREKLDAFSVLVRILAGAVAELADAEDLKSSARKSMWVRVPPAPLNINNS